jgi:S-adenosylmethionine/arginine decarboxylase-like enzyme
MQHFMIDGYGGFRSRFDDIRLVQEVLDEVPVRAGLQPAMPAFLLPYYNGVVPEDCGVSGFVFLPGGHLTVHTFSFREAYFADLVAPTGFEGERLAGMLEDAFPCAKTVVSDSRRDEVSPADPNRRADFGPHLIVEIEDYRGASDMDGLFPLFDRLPGEIGMTPIMRPYLIQAELDRGQPVLSAMTMIAESHVSLHLLPEERRAYFDLFSCSFFDAGEVLPRLREQLPGRWVREVLIPRGRDYRVLRTERADERRRTSSWLDAIR